MLSVVDFLFSKFDIELLVFDFLGEEVVFTVVAHIVLILGVLSNHSVGLVGCFRLLLDGGIKCGNFLVVFRNASLKTFNFIFQVLNFEREFTTESFDAVHFRENGLQFVECFQAFFYIEFFFFCHNVIKCILLDFVLRLRISLQSRGGPMR